MKDRASLATRWIWVAILGVTFVASTVEAGMAEARKDRNQLDDRFKWQVADLYPSAQAWEQDLKKLQTNMKAFGGCQGKLSSGRQRLSACLEQLFDLHKRFARLSNYASRLHDQDAKDQQGQQLHERIGQVGTELRTAVAFVEPEILAVDPGRLARWMRDSSMADVRQFVDNITRRREHVLDAAGEKLVARAGDLAGVPENVYKILSTINLKFPTVTLKSGLQVELSQAMYTRFRSLPDRRDRQKVFGAFFGAYQSLRETMSGLLAGAVKRDHFYAGARGYADDLTAALDETNVPKDIYTNMIAQVRSGLPLMWRYMKLRGKLLGVNKLGYHDLYTSIVPAVKMEVPWEKARAIVLEALSPLGEEYQDIMRQAFDLRWTDVYPTQDKRSGAYMSGSAYDVHPYVLLNYNDDYESLSTLAHEFGHAGHSYLSNKHQPYVNADYPIFVAEVASTVNEDLLRLHLTAQAESPKDKLFLIGQYLENWRQTVFRQALFAEFELKIHQMHAVGQPLTADLLDSTYLKLLREYYGHDQGVVDIDPLYAVEWAYVPHFYYNFYMFQYTTSFIASTAIARRIRAKDKAARPSYLKMLRAGGSKYPVDLLKMGGVDMTVATPYVEAFRALEEALGEAEKLVGD